MSVFLGCALTDRWCHSEREVIHRQQPSEAEWSLSTRCSQPRHYTLQPQCKQCYFQPWCCTEQSDLMASYWSALLSNLSGSLASSLCPYLLSLFEKLLYIQAWIRWCISEWDLSARLIGGPRVLNDSFANLMQYYIFAPVINCSENSNNCASC